MRPHRATRALAALTLLATATACATRQEPGWWRTEPQSGKGSSSDIRLVDHWVDADFDRIEFRKILVVGITDDREARRHFENKFVSHVRSRQIEGVTSYSLVPDLTHIEAEESVKQQITSLGIDGVITVRVVELQHRDEGGWIEGWQQDLETEGDVRRLIEDSLPVTRTSGSHYGAEVALWETANGSRIWAGRSAAFSAKALNKGRSGAFIQSVMDRLKLDRLL